MIDLYDLFQRVLKLKSIFLSDDLNLPVEYWLLETPCKELTTEKDCC